MVISSDTVRLARHEGVYGDTAKRVARMIKRSSLCTSKFGNRRFLSWIFYVKDGNLINITRSV